MDNKRVLILTTNYGDGHIKAAGSLKNEINKQDETIEVKVVNLFLEAHPLLNKIIRELYLNCYSHMPQFYGFIYYLTKDIRTNLYLNFINGLMGRKKLKEYLEEFKPSVVINTFPVLAMPMLYRKGKTKVPCYTIITDYGVHSQWIDQGVSRYFIGDECMKKELTDQGIDEEKISVTGIPVCIECGTIDKERFFCKYGLENYNLPVVTLLAGAHGVLRNFREAGKLLYEIKPEAQFIIACGKNKALREAVEKATADYRDRIKVFGFVDNIHELMKGSDIVVSKPGGITTTEVLNMNVPMVVFGSPAGQENENAKYLLRNGCSHHAHNLSELIDILSQLLKDKDKLSCMKESAKQICKPNGCVEMAEYIVRELNNKTENIDG